MSSPDREKELKKLDEFIEFCRKQDEKHKIINNKILPILFKLPIKKLIVLTKKLTKERI